MTLTYPASYPGDPIKLKRHLASFWKRLRRKYPWVSAIWRVELQERGAPHYHLLLFGVSFLAWQWVAKNWYEIVGSGDPQHLNAGTEIHAALSWRLAAHYLAKYIAKAAPEDHLQAIGRHWGIMGRANLPREMLAYTITWELFDEVRATLINLITRGHPEDWPGNNYSGVWANLPNYRPPPNAAWPVDTRTPTVVS
jgi:hypothetical protein